jgi:hypothetical protein
VTRHDDRLIILADVAREREELRDALESRAQILGESSDQPRAAEQAERELDRQRRSQVAPAAQRRGRQGKAAESGQ